MTDRDRPRRVVPRPLGTPAAPAAAGQAGRHARGPRDLPQPPGREHLRRPPLRLRPPDGLPPPLRLLRHAARLPRRASPDASTRCVAGPWSSAIRLVEITGGEPLLQPEVFPLMARLADAGRTVLLETSGAVDIAPVDPRVRIILDLKTPGSGEVEANVWSNLDRLKPIDEVKFVLCDRADFDWAVGRRPRPSPDRPLPRPLQRRVRPGQPDRAGRLDPRNPPARSASSSSSTRSSGTPAAGRLSVAPAPHEGTSPMTSLRRRRTRDLACRMAAGETPKSAAISAGACPLDGSAREGEPRASSNSQRTSSRARWHSPLMPSSSARSSGRSHSGSGSSRIC